MNTSVPNTQPIAGLDYFGYESLFEAIKGESPNATMQRMLDMNMEGKEGVAIWGKDLSTPNEKKDRESQDMPTLTQVIECANKVFKGGNKIVAVRVLGSLRVTEEERNNSLKKLRNDNEVNPKASFIIPAGLNKEDFVLKAGALKAGMYFVIRPGTSTLIDFMGGSMSHFEQFLKELGVRGYFRGSKWEGFIETVANGKEFFAWHPEFFIHAPKVMASKIFLEHGEIDFVNSRNRFANNLKNANKKLIEEPDAPPAKTAERMETVANMQRYLDCSDVELRETVVEECIAEFFKLNADGVSAVPPAIIKDVGAKTMLAKKVFGGVEGVCDGINTATLVAPNDELSGFTLEKAANVTANEANCACVQLRRAAGDEHYMAFLQMLAETESAFREKAIFNKAQFDDNQWSAGQGCPHYFVRMHEMLNNPSEDPKNMTGKFNNTYGHGITLAILLYKGFPCGSIYTQELRNVVWEKFGITSETTLDEICIKLLDFVYYRYMYFFDAFPVDQKVKPDPEETEDLDALVLDDEKYEEFMLADDDLPEEIEAWLSTFSDSSRKKLLARKRARAAEEEASNKRPNSNPEMTARSNSCMPRTLSDA